MEFIKKHYEKILLAAALIVLIVSAGFLAFRVSTLSAEVSTAQFRPRPKPKIVKPGDMNLYSNAIVSLRSPALWKTYPNSPFPPDRIEGPKTTVVVVPKGDPIALAKIIRQPFKLIFRSYTGQGRNFQVDFLTGGRSFFVEKVGDEVADRFGNSGGYITTKFEPKTKSVFNPALGYTNEVDVSELTIQHPGDDPIVMPVNKVVEEKEPVAVVQCADGFDQFQIRRGQKFDCGTNTYNVVDITSTQVIIVHKLTKEKWTIGTAGGR